MVFLSWNRPTPQQQQSCIAKSGEFNYDSQYRGATSKHISELQGLAAAQGFHLNHARVLLGSGTHVFDKAKTALQSWSHFGLDWAFVDPKTPVEKGVKFCVCTKQLIPWLTMPLQVVYVDHTPRASFGFGSGTLGGHLLAGEERFSIELDEKNQVWYEILSLSKPDHILSRIAYPLVQMNQKHFAQQSAKAIVKHVSSD
uniref:DUF1990 domain-containing protein n=1 Tax=Kalanchoe fedtschenkoi TaxID=63787 RepID=A0A7N0TEX9_KALFE